MNIVLAPSGRGRGRGGDKGKKNLILNYMKEQQDKRQKIEQPSNDQQWDEMDEESQDSNFEDHLNNKIKSNVTNEENKSNNKINDDEDQNIFNTYENTSINTIDYEEGSTGKINDKSYIVQVSKLLTRDQVEEDDDNILKNIAKASSKFIKHWITEKLIKGIYREINHEVICTVQNYNEWVHDFRVIGTKRVYAQIYFQVCSTVKWKTLIDNGKSIFAEENLNVSLKRI